MKNNFNTGQPSKISHAIFPQIPGLPRHLTRSGCAVTWYIVRGFSDADTDGDTEAEAEAVKAEKSEPTSPASNSPRRPIQEGSYKVKVVISESNIHRNPTLIAT
jgi:hypothetical protein